VGAFQFHQPDRRTFGSDIQDTNVPKHSSTALGRLQACEHFRIERAKTVEKLLCGTTGEAFRHQAFQFNILQLQAKADLAAQNNQFAGDVRAREIVARIRLCVASVPGLSDDRRKRLLAIPHVE
jgi:hypothetical protein